jgi:hypothetical protein
MQTSMQAIMLLQAAHCLAKYSSTVICLPRSEKAGRSPPRAAHSCRALVHVLAAVLRL